MIRCTAFFCNFVQKYGFWLSPAKFLMLFYSTYLPAETSSAAGGSGRETCNQVNNKKLYIETYGCQMNVADSEVVAAVMGMAGYDTVDSVEEADAILLNTCSIRDNAEQKILSRLQTLAALRRKNRSRRLIVGVIGCMAERVREGLVEHHGVDIVAGPDAYLDLPNLFAAAETGARAVNVELSTTETYRDIIPSRITGNRVSGFLSIMRGCNNFCSYCIVPYTRGRERSREVDSILREVADLRARGFREVTLLGQNVNSYRYAGPDGETVNFARLLALVAEAAPDMRVRFSTSHPKDMSDETIDTIARYPNICNHVHLPVQSGSNAVLKSMNPRVVSGPCGLHPRAYTRLRSLYRPFHRFPQRERGGFRADTLADARGRFRLGVHVQVFRAPRHACLARDA